MKNEIESVISKAYTKDAAIKMKDVYVTNHEPKDKKYVTISAKEDQEFYRYKKSVEEYNNGLIKRGSKKLLRFDKGTLL